MSARTLDAEKAIQARIKELAALHGFHISDLSQPRASMQTPGIPDLYLFHPKRHFRTWVEVKKPGGKLSRAQRAWHKIAMESGVRVWVCRSAEEFQAYLESYGFGGGKG